MAIVDDDNMGIWVYIYDETTYVKGMRLPTNNDATSTYK